MPESVIFDRTVNFLGKALNVAARRQSLITTNIANLDTVGYQPQDLDFKKTLQGELEKRPGQMTHTHAAHFSRGSDAGQPPLGGSRARLGETDDPVDIDTEMTHLVDNNVKYRTSVEMLLRKMGMLKYAITEGGK